MNQILNFHPFGQLYATAGQPAAEQFAVIAESGYRTVINLAMHDSDHAIANEGSIVAALGMDYFHMPIPFDRPVKTHLEKFFKVMDILDGEQVFVHCALNVRVSVFMFKYLTLRKGVSVTAATSPVLAQWLPDITPPWQTIMDLTLAELDVNVS